MEELYLLYTSVQNGTKKKKKRASRIAVCLFFWKSEHEVSVLVPGRVEPGAWALVSLNIVFYVTEVLV